MLTRMQYVWLRALAPIQHTQLRRFEVQNVIDTGMVKITSGVAAASLQGSQGFGFHQPLWGRPDHGSHESELRDTLGLPVCFPEEVARDEVGQAHEAAQAYRVQLVCTLVHKRNILPLRMCLTCMLETRMKYLYNYFILISAASVVHPSALSLRGCSPCQSAR
jgi:hypothetical protein